MKINLEAGKDTKTDDYERDYDSRTEKWYKRVDDHPYLSGIGIILAGWILFQVIPFGFFAFLPEWAFKYLKLGIYGAIPSWIFGRRIANWLYTVPLDIIVVGDPGAEHVTEAFKYRKGRFLEEYDFEVGEPITWTNPAGMRVYQVTELDRAEKVAKCSWISDLSSWEVLKFRERWEAQKLWNDRQRQKAAELQLKMSQVTSQARADISNAWIRKLDSLEDVEELQEAGKNAIPEDIRPDDDVELDNILEDLEGPSDLAEKISEKERDGFEK